MTLRLAFMGTPDFAVPLLSKLLDEGHDIAAVYSQPARPKGRGMKEEPSPVAKLALAHGLEVRTPVSLRQPEPQAAFAALNLDVAVVAAYGLILPKPILDAPRLGCWNLHGSLLPRWRGAAPIQRAVMTGDTETGVMVMRMEEGLDTGPVLLSEKTPIGFKTAGELTNELADKGANLMARGLRILERGSYTTTPQAEEGVTYAKKIDKSEARIDWNKPAAEVDRLIRGLSPWPGAWTEVKGERFKILKSKIGVFYNSNHTPGTVLAIDNALVVGCANDTTIDVEEAQTINIEVAQRAGGKPMQTKDLLRGFHLEPGTRFV
jgi:methionyl-tRNA formyltransferase